MSKSEALTRWVAHLEIHRETMSYTLHSIEPVGDLLRNPRPCVIVEARDELEAFNQVREILDNMSMSHRLTDGAEH